MDNFTKHKRDIEVKVTNTIIASLENGKLKEADLPGLSDLILKRIDTIDSEEALASFLQELAGKWEIFAPVLMLEKEKTNAEEEKKVVERVVSLAQNGQIDDAISLAKTATE